VQLLETRRAPPAKDRCRPSCSRQRANFRADAAHLLERKPSFGRGRRGSAERTIQDRAGLGQVHHLAEAIQKWQAERLLELFDWYETDGWLKRSCCAARLKLLRSATVLKVRIDAASPSGQGPSEGCIRARRLRYMRNGCRRPKSLTPVRRTTPSLKPSRRPTGRKPQSRNRRSTVPAAPATGAARGNEAAKRAGALREKRPRETASRLAA